MPDDSDQAVGLLSSDFSAVGVELFVEASGAKSAVLRQQDKNRHALEVAERGVVRARGVLPRGRVRVQAEANLAVAEEASLEQADSLADLGRLGRKCMVLADAVPDSATRSRFDLRLRASSIGRRIGNEDLARRALRAAEAEAMSITGWNQTIQYAFSQAMFALQWGSKADADEYLTAAFRLSEEEGESPSWQILLPFGMARQEIQFGNRDEGIVLLAGAYEDALKAGWLRACRVGHKDLASLIES